LKFFEKSFLKGILTLDNHINTVESLVKASEFKPQSLKPPNAWVGHMPFAYWLIDQLKPDVFVELGTHTGNSYFSFCQSVKDHLLQTQCFAIDTWQGDEHAGNYDEEIYYTVLKHNEANYQEFSRLMRMTFDNALSHFDDKSIDLLHIDGLHTYEAVKHDFESWLPKMAPGGIILFHDTQVIERDFGVIKLWKEIQSKYSLNLEFNHSNGLGVMRLNDFKNENKILWLNKKSIQKDLITRYFTSIGLLALEQFDSVEKNKKIYQQNAHIEKLQQSIDSILNSSSWKITKPLRGIRKFLSQYFTS
jgi:hypothetical protein